MNQHFDLYHQNQNDFYQLTSADVNCALKKTKPLTKEKPRRQCSFSLLYKAQHIICMFIQTTFLHKISEDRGKLRNPPDLTHSLYLYLQRFNHLTPALCSRRYEVQLQACTELGCASSEWASAQTLEAPPAVQPAPLIEIQTAGGFQSTASILWTGPKQPNGKILYYELYRRRTTQAHINLDLSLVYNGSSTSFKDDKLLPYTEYEYQVGIEAI